MLPRRKRAALAAAVATGRPRRRAKPMSTLRAILTVLGSRRGAAGHRASRPLSMRLGLPDGGSEPAGLDAATGVPRSSTRSSARARTARCWSSPTVRRADRPTTSSSPTQVEVAQQLAGPRRRGRRRADRAPPTTARSLAFQVVPAEGPNSESTEQLVQRPPRASPPVDGGDSRSASPARRRATSTSRRSSPTRCRSTSLVVVGLSLLIMILVFRSLLVPLDRDRRVRPVAASRRYGAHRRRVPVGLVRGAVRRARHRRRS